jgi:hypothetical protein
MSNSATTKRRRLSGNWSLKAGSDDCNGSPLDAADLYVNDDVNEKNERLTDD